MPEKAAPKRAPRRKATPKKQEEVYTGPAITACYKGPFAHCWLEQANGTPLKLVKDQVVRIPSTHDAEGILMETSRWADDGTPILKLDEVA